MGLPDLVGLLGAFFYLLAYALLQLRKIEVEDWRYTVMNILGGVLLIASLFWSFNLGSLVSQSAWLLFTMIGFMRNRMIARNGAAPVIAAPVIATPVIATEA